MCFGVCAQLAELLKNMRVDIFLAVQALTL